MTHTSPSTAGCPICREAKVIAHFPSFHEMHRGVTVETCQPCRAETGMTSAHMKASAVPPAPEFRVRHTTGLVEFG